LSLSHHLHIWRTSTRRSPALTVRAGLTPILKPDCPMVSGSTSRCTRQIANESPCALDDRSMVSLSNIDAGTTGASQAVARRPATLAPYGTILACGCAQHADLVCLCLRHPCLLSSPLLPTTRDDLYP